jgi:3-hydroxyisobutyrate dehydrogenase-like beta-hydroxyacid dehydrogenase
MMRGALWLDLNSVAPATKRDAAKAVAAAGGHYVDVAVMAPVHPKRRSTPLLVSGTHADVAIALLGTLGFNQVRMVDGGIGAASAIKMIRSVMVKGLEALTAECVLAAHNAGVLDEVLASLDASPAPQSWRERADYNLDRMLVHGLRRAAEMEEVVKTLDALGVDTALTRGTADRQRALGRLGLGKAPAGLEAKLKTIAAAPRKDAA